MRARTELLACAVAAMIVSGPAVAQDKAAARRMLEQLYRLDLADELCDLDLPEASVDKVDRAVEKVERSAGLKQEELDAIYADVEAKANVDKTAFCEALAKTAEDDIRKLPN